MMSFGYGTARGELQVINFENVICCLLMCLCNFLLAAQGFSLWP